MKNAIDVFLGDPLEHRSERDFLARLKADLFQRQVGGLVFANFYAGRDLRQVDFLIVTNTLACHVELKSLQEALVGGPNGPWQVRSTDGTLKPLDRENPYQQTLQCKYAISDSMREFARRTPETPQTQGPHFKQIESVLCIYPELVRGSQVPTNSYVRTMGYDALLEFLCRTTRNPGWTLDIWIKYAMAMQLVRDDPSATPSSVQYARESVSLYRVRMKESVHSQMRTLIPLTLKEQDRTLSTGDLYSSLGDDKHFHILGPSGFGKTMLAHHLAAEAPDNLLPLVIRAADYEGPLSALLDRSIAPYHPHSFMHLSACAKAAAKKPILIVDDLGACPTEHLPELLKELQAHSLRFRSQLVFTSKEDLPLPPALTGRKLSLTPLTPEERRAVLGLHLGHVPSAEQETLCQPFSTPFELGIAAACWSQDTPINSRHQLLDAFISQCCSRTKHPILIRSLLHAIGKEMLSQLRSRITVGTFSRLLAPLLSKNNLPTSAIEDLLGCGLLMQRLGNVHFTHEQIESFIQGEAITLTVENPTNLADLIGQPRNRHLVEPVVALLKGTGAIQGVLRTVADTAIFAKCLRGELGELVMKAAMEQAQDNLALIEQDIPNLSPLPLETEPNSIPFIRFTGQRRWSSAERALQETIGMMLTEGIFLTDVLRIIEQTDARWSAISDQCETPKDRRLLLNHLFRSTYAVSSENCPPLSRIMQACQRGVFSSPMSEHLKAGLPVLLNELEHRTPGQLYLLCQFLRRQPQLEASALVAFFNKCWTSGLYNLRLAVLDALGAYASHNDEGLRNQLVQALGSIDSTRIDIMLSSQLVDVLSRFGAIESPVPTDEASGEAQEILARVETREGQEAAYHWISNIFEEVFSAAYSEAFAALTSADRARLLTGAALGAPSYGGHTEWCLLVLLQLKDPVALPAFVHWAARVNTNAFSSQEAAGAFALACAGAATLCPEPPPWAGGTGSDEEAWNTWGKIIFWTHNPRLDETQRGDKCRPLWESLSNNLRCEAVDPLTHFLSSLFCREPESPIRRVINMWRDQVRCLLESGLRNMHHLTSVFPHGEWRADSRNQCMLQLLGEVGTVQSEAALEPLVDHPELGVRAVEVLKKIRSSRE